MSHVQYILYFYISTSRCMCVCVCTVPNMPGFCSSLISRFPSTLLRYCRSDFKMVPSAPSLTGITFAFTFHMRCILLLLLLLPYPTYAEPKFYRDIRWLNFDLIRSNCPSDICADVANALGSGFDILNRNSISINGLQFVDNLTGSIHS